MEIKSRTCRASPESATSYRTPSRRRCLTSTSVPAGFIRLAHSAGSAPGFPSRGTRSSPRGCGQSRRRDAVRAPPRKLCEAGSALPEPSHLVTWLPLRYRQQQPQQPPAARGQRERSVATPPARESGGTYDRRVRGSPPRPYRR